ncbi:hypothetical protein PPERSA_11946 [Pseudocohnilembus persalinus]|uniref:Zinc finger, FYVE/PHD-type n=1 Tax=Pseudocohnilembus persalinus TaxID=266149 RepID=A0A0V0QK57_PSEPJ|nr:hypothetical protein PPERSA_11946 [Pseudocohnilembus persalinus]|eukprot:KRX02606.1 hypothetical protein PPERSA_11946 [Pseudocohnilembus persalinus]
MCQENTIRNLEEKEKEKLQNKYEEILFFPDKDENDKEDKELCDFCLTDTKYESDDLYYCDLCNCLIHQSCYGSELLNGLSCNCESKSCNYHFHATCAKREGIVRNLAVMNNIQICLDHIPLYCYPQQIDAADRMRYIYSTNKQKLYCYLQGIEKKKCKFLPSDFKPFKQLDNKENINKNQGNNFNSKRTLSQSYKQGKNKNMSEDQKVLEQARNMLRQMDLRNIHLLVDKKNIINNCGQVHIEEDDLKCSFNSQADVLWQLFLQETQNLPQEMTIGRMKDEVAFFFVRNGCLDAEKKIIDVENEQQQQEQIPIQNLISQNNKQSVIGTPPTNSIDNSDILKSNQKIFQFLPESKINKGQKMKLLELLYGDHYQKKNKVQVKWRKVLLIALFSSMVYRAFENVRKLGYQILGIY